MKRLLLAVLFLSGCSSVQTTPKAATIPAEAVRTPIPCIDHLGLAKYGDTFVRSHPDGFGFGVFTQKDLFGDPVPYIDRRLGKGGIPVVRYNLRWSDTHTFTTRDFPRIVQEARRLLPLVNKYPRVGCEFSGATEHKLGVRDATDLANRVLAVIPERCKYVNNPWTGYGSFIPTSARVKNEVHGSDAQPPKIGGAHNVSTDGSDVFDINFTALKNRFPNADAVFAWSSANNGRRNASDTTPRPQRKFWPTPRLIRAQAFMFTDQGPGKLPLKHLIKPVSDRHSVVPADREYKPVLIFPGNAPRITLKVGNKVIATSELRQPYADGRSRYYFPSGYGYQIMQESGGNTVDIWAGSKKLGQGNVAFRNSEYR